MSTNKVALTRRDFLASAGAAALTAAVPAFRAWAAPAADDRPNILFIMTDQHTAGALSCAGNGYLKTPAIDGLAASGIRFERAYTEQPLCVPWRTVMMTGRMPHQTGAVTNRSVQGPDLKAFAERNPQIPTLGSLVAAAGYRCGYAGKWHLPFGTADAAAHGFTVMRGGDGAIAGNFARFLDERQQGPFFFFASYLNPHNICEWARGQPTPLGDPPAPDACPPLPANFGVPADTPEMVLSARHALGAPDVPDHPENLMTAISGIHPTRDWTPEKWRQYVWAYYRLVELVDGQIGGTLKVLRDRGLSDRTVVVFTADHGDGCAAHHWNQKSALYEEAVRVPMIVSRPGSPAAGRTDREHLVSGGLDMIPTLCDYAGAKMPPGMAGRSLMPLAEGQHVAAWRDQVVSETVLYTLDRRGRMIRTQKYKYVLYERGNHREQLFDLDADPGEMKNLAADPAAAEVLRDHRRRLAAWSAETRDDFPTAPPA